MSWNSARLARLNDSRQKTYTEADIAALKAKNFELIGKNRNLSERVTTLEDLVFAKGKKDKRGTPDDRTVRA